jgi:hypothetical protein
MADGIVVAAPLTYVARSTDRNRYPSSFPGYDSTRIDVNRRSSVTSLGSDFDFVENEADSDSNMGISSSVSPLKSFHRTRKG